jgi:hypothetical protein
MNNTIYNPNALVPVAVDGTTGLPTPLITGAGGALTVLGSFAAAPNQTVQVTNQLLNTTVAPQLVAAGTASAASAVVSAAAKFVVINPTVDAWVSIGATPVAAVNTSGNIFMAGGSQSYPFTVTGGTTKVAAIASNSSLTGFITVTEGQ